MTPGVGDVAADAGVVVDVFGVHRSNRSSASQDAPDSSGITQKGNKVNSAKPVGGGSLPNVRVKALASKSWCEAASLVRVPSDSLGQPQKWEYLVISESMVRQRQNQPFEHLALAGREKTEEITRFAQGKLF